MATTFEEIDESAKLQVRQLLPEIMKQIRECDAVIDEQGFCRCARFIEHWLFLFKRNELVERKFQAVEQSVQRTAVHVCETVNPATNRCIECGAVQE